MEPDKIFLLLLLSGLVLTFAFCMANLVINDEACDLKRWKQRRRELEAERILAAAKATDDGWMVEHEARVQAHEVMRPEIPGWAFWIAR